MILFVIHHSTQEFHIYTMQFNQTGRTNAKSKLRCILQFIFCCNRSSKSNDLSLFNMHTTNKNSSAARYKKKKPVRVRVFSLTVIKVNVFGDLVPGSVIEVANLLLVLHHTSRFAFFLILQSNVVLYGLKVLPMLRQKARWKEK